MSSKNLLILATVTALVVVAAFAAVFIRQSATESEFDPRPLVAGLKNRVNDVARIEIITQRDRTEVIADASGTWRVASRAGWHANLEEVRSTVLAVAELTAVERRTARPSRHEQLGLVAPGDGGAAIRVRLSAADGEVLADLIFGAIEEAPQLGQPGTAYVRWADEDQTYLVSGDVAVNTLPSQWLDRDLVDLPPARIGSVRVAPRVGPAYVIARDESVENNAPRFVLSEMPEGKRLASASLPQTIANGLTDLTLDDVVPAGEITFEAPAVATYRTVDGVVVDVTTMQDKDEYWSVFDVSVDEERLGEDAATRRAEADALNARLAGWAFKLSPFKATNFARRYSSLFAGEEEETGALTPP